MSAVIQVLCPSDVHAVHPRGKLAGEPAGCYAAGEAAIDAAIDAAMAASAAVSPSSGKPHPCRPPRGARRGSSSNHSSGRLN